MIKMKTVRSAERLDGEQPALAACTAMKGVPQRAAEKLRGRDERRVANPSPSG